MDAKTKEMVRGWVASDNGDIEKTARWMAYTLKLAGIKACREMIAEATKEEEMTKEQFNARRAEIYRGMVAEARNDIKAKGTCSRGRIMATAKAVATKRFFELEAKIYA